MAPDVMFCDKVEYLHRNYFGGKISSKICSENRIKLRNCKILYQYVELRLVSFFLMFSFTF